MKHNLIFGSFWHTQKLLLLKNNKYIFTAAEMRKEDTKFPKYHKAHATNFKFVSKLFFKFQDIEDKNATKTSESKNTQNFFARNDNKTKNIQT